MIGKLKALLQRRQPPEWSHQYISGRDWEEVPHPQVPATARQRKANLQVWAMVMALPFALLSCFNSCGARGIALSAGSLANQAIDAVEDREAAETPDLLIDAIATTQRRLGVTRHRLSAAALVSDGFRVVDTGEEHTIGVVDDGRHALTAVSVVDDAGTVGVTFAPSVAAPDSAGTVAAPAACWRPPVPAGEDPPAGSWLSLLGSIRPHATLSDYWPQDAVAVAVIDMDKLHAWLRAWVSGDQPAMRELGNYTSADPLPWFSAPGYRYAEGSARPVSVVQLDVDDERRLIAHVQFAMCDSESPDGLLVQDMEVEMRRDDTLLRVLAGSPLGAPL